jgi:hypothetical protein
VDPALLAGAILGIVRPFIRGFWSRQEAAVERLGEKVSDASQDLAERVWHRLFPSVRKDEGANVAARRLASTPDDDDLAQVFQLQLKKLLEHDPALAHDLAQTVGSRREGDVTFYGPVTAEQGGIVTGRVEGGISQTFGNDKP